MSSLRRALIYGVLVWLLPFVIAFLLFPVRESARPLFESIMPVAIAAVVASAAVAYFDRVRIPGVREGAIVGLVWLGLSLLIDAPLMLLGGPMQMNMAEYLADVGVTYLMIPVITAGVALAFARGRSDSAAAAEEEA